MHFYKIRDLVELLGIADYRIYYLLRHGKIPPPNRDSSGDYVWTETDVERIKQKLNLDLIGV